MDKLTDFVQDKLHDKDDKKHGSSSFPGGNIPMGGAYPPVSAEDDDDFKGAAAEASRRAGDSGTEDMFNNVLGMLVSKKKKVAEEDIDEETAVKSHKKFFGDDDDDNHADDGGMGAAAAMQALKLFAGGSGSSTGESKQSQGAFVALAMSEASKLFDQKSSQGKVAEGSSKESAVMQAGEMAFKMYLKSQGSSGHKQDSGTSGLMHLASKFM